MGAVVGASGREVSGGRDQAPAARACMRNVLRRLADYKNGELNRLKKYSTFCFPKNAGVCYKLFPQPTRDMKAKTSSKRNRSRDRKGRGLTGDVEFPVEVERRALGWVFWWLRLRRGWSAEEEAKVAKIGEQTVRDAWRAGGGWPKLLPWESGEGEGVNIQH